MHVHGNNLTQKLGHPSKYNDPDAKALLATILPVYTKWKSDNEMLKGPFAKGAAGDERLVAERTALFAAYKEFIDRQHIAEAFDSRSNLHSSVLEEFLYYLFRDVAASLSTSALIGKSSTFKDIFFRATSYSAMLASPCAVLECKDHDFIIGVRVNAAFTSQGMPVDTTQNQVLDVPVVAIECKTYLDKTMLEGSSMAATQLKTKNPNALYMVVSEWLKLSEDLNLRKYLVDQIYVLRKQKNTDREFRYLSTYVKNPIYPDVVWRLFEGVRGHLTADWGKSLEAGLERGYLL